LRSQIRAVPRMLGRAPKEIKEYPTYGPERREAELTSVGISVGRTGIYNILKKRCLTTAKALLEWVRKLSGEIITQDEIIRDKEKATKNYVEATY